MTPSEKISKAKIQLVLSQPFFATLALSLEYIETASVPTACVNGKRLWYNPNFVDSLSLDQVKGLLAHEVMHPALLHHTRRGNRDLNLWNDACDYVINPLILKAGFTLPEGYIYRNEFIGKDADSIYKVLLAEKQAEEEQKAKAQKDDSEDDESDDPNDDYNDQSENDDWDEDDSDEDDSEDDSEEAENPDSDERSEDDMNDDTGDEEKDDSSAPDEVSEDSDDSGESEGEDKSDEDSESGDSEGDGDKDSKEDDPFGNLRNVDQGGWGEVIDAEVQTENESKETEAQAKQLMAEAAETARQAGKLPGDIERLIDEILEPKVPWQEVLMRFISETARNDYNWKRPNSRYTASGLYLPTLENTELGKVAFIVDTSISIDKKLLNQFGSELQEAAALFKFPALVIYVDTVVQGVQDLEEDTELIPRGGGGTDFRPGFKYIEENEPDIVATVYLTDGYCRWFPQEPDYPVLWAVYNNKNFTPPFGEVVEVDD